MSQRLSMREPIGLSVRSITSSNVVAPSLGEESISRLRAVKRSNHTYASFCILFTRDTWSIRLCSVSERYCITAPAAAMASCILSMPKPFMDAVLKCFCSVSRPKLGEKAQSSSMYVRYVSPKTSRKRTLFRRS